MKLATINDGQVNGIFEADTLPVYAPYIVVKDITNISPQPQEGWDYNADTDTYSEHVEATTTTDTVTIDDMTKYLYYKATGAVS